MKLTIEVDEQELTEMVTRKLCENIASQCGCDHREVRIGLRDGVDKAIRNYIYKEKDNIIERVIERATREIVKKGLPRLIENIQCEK